MSHFWYPTCRVHYEIDYTVVMKIKLNTLKKELTLSRSLFLEFAKQ